MLDVEAGETDVGVEVDLVAEAVAMYEGDAGAGVEAAAGEGPGDEVVFAFW